MSTTTTTTTTATAATATASPAAAPLRVDVFADIACPWCYLGKRQLEKALERYPQPIEVRHRAYQLNPGASPAGEPATAYLLRKFGSSARVEESHARLVAMGGPVGIQFNWEKQVATNTRLAHRVVAIAAGQGQEQAALDAIYRAYFEEGVNVADQTALLAALQRHGVALDYPALLAGLADGAGEESVDRDIREARELGIDGVPLFLAGGRLAVSGAQPAEVLRSFLEEAARRSAAGEQ